MLQKTSFCVIVAAVITGFYFLYYSQSQSKCDDYYADNCPDRFFSTSYFEARNKFLEISKLIPSANMYSLPIFKTKSNQDLYIDITILNEDSSSNHLITHSSATHGNEGYAGSAIQNGILQFINNYTFNGIEAVTTNLFDANSMLEYIGTDTIINDKNPIIILIHSVNPYGFLEGIRTNENNVDLNRNLKTKTEWDAFTAMHPNKYHYEDLNAFFNPTFNFLPFIRNIQQLFPPYLASILTSIYFQLSYHSFYFAAFYHILLKFGLNVRIPAVALVVGSTKFPNGLGYVGEPYIRQESHKKLAEFIENLFGKHPVWRQQIEKISSIDVHTGLGAYGKDTLLVTTDEEENKLLQYEMRRSTNNENVMNLMRVKGNDAFGDMYNDVTGTNVEYINMMLSLLGKERKDMDVLAVGQEFGTCLLQTSVLQALRFSNAVYWEYINATDMHGKSGIVNDAVLKELEFVVDKAREIEKNAFYVEDVEWKRDVVQRGFVLFASLFKR